MKKDEQEGSAKFNLLETFFAKEVQQAEDSVSVSKGLAEPISAQIT